MQTIPQRVPYIVRWIICVSAFAATLTAGAGHLTTCTFGEARYNSKQQLDLMVAANTIVFISFLVRLISVDIKRHALPRLPVLLGLEVACLLLLCLAMISSSTSPVISNVCNNPDMQSFLEEVCQFNCANILGAIMITGLTAFGVFLQLLFTTGTIPVQNLDTEDYTFDETFGTPRAAKSGLSVQL